MQIKDLQPKQGKVDIIVTVTDKSAPKEFQKFGNPGRLCNIKVHDESGEVAMTLWNEQVDQVNMGDKIKITNGYVNEWQGEMQLSTGKFGKFEIIGKDDTKTAVLAAAKQASTKTLGTKDEEAVDDEEYDDKQEDNQDNEEEELEEDEHHDNIKEEEI